MRKYNVFTWTTVCLWFALGDGYPHRRTIDTIISRKPPQGGFKWNKNVEAYARWIRDFTNPYDIVFDPFTGTGTVPAVCRATGCNYIAFEQDEETAEFARQRVQMSLQMSF